MSISKQSLCEGGIGFPTRLDEDAMSRDHTRSGTDLCGSGFEGAGPGHNWCCQVRTRSAVGVARHRGLCTITEAFKPDVVQLAELAGNEDALKPREEAELALLGEVFTER
jgi:hypothetical protein